MRRQEKVRNSVRVEFRCGMRAVRRARADFEALSRVAQMFSGGLDEVPALAAAQAEALRNGDRLRRKQELELAGYRGRDLYATTAPDEAGLRRILRRSPSGSLEELRALAQSFTEQPKAVFVAALEQPPSVLLAVSADSHMDAGGLLKRALAEARGRGGGNSRLAQGSLPSREALEQTLEQIKRS
jgi:alanyl-tRNA synthetase